MSLVVFVRKRLVEIQYLRTAITNEQRHEFGHLVRDAMRQIGQRHRRELDHSVQRLPFRITTRMI